MRAIAFLFGLFPAFVLAQSAVYDGQLVTIKRLVVPSGAENSVQFNGNPNPTECHNRHFYGDSDLLPFFLDARASQETVEVDIEDSQVGAVSICRVSHAEHLNK